MSNKVAIITRSYNRLEYTIKCIDNVSRTTTHDNYTHFIINNNSTDGTPQWLDWIKQYGNHDYYKNVIPFNMDENYGDWGGMLKSLELIGDEYKYIVQLDNDITISDSLWLDKMIHILEDDNSIVQLKRIGVSTNIPTVNNRVVKYNDIDLHIGNINRPVACYMLRVSDFNSMLPQLIGSQLLDINGKVSGKTKLSHLLGNKTVKLNNVHCFMIDGIHEGRLNYKKYPQKVVWNGK